MRCYKCGSPNGRKRYQGLCKRDKELHRKRIKNYMRLTWPRVRP